ncbi:MAG: hypothetical protein NW237_09245 [Cyanobacteriota bacterium]|nr:hypothetical protein [Cyanobacteriota bacterium]
MRVADFQSTLPIPAPELPASVDPNDAIGVEKYIFSLLIHSAHVETKLNESLPRTQRENRFGLTISEDGSLKASIAGQTQLSDLQIS